MVRKAQPYPPDFVRADGTTYRPDYGRIEFARRRGLPVAPVAIEDGFFALPEQRHMLFDDDLSIERRAGTAVARGGGGNGGFALAVVAVAVVAIGATMVTLK